MEWISFADRTPELDEKVLVYKCRDMGGYYKGIYIASYGKIYETRFFIVINDRETNKNNYRGIDEFSHWMPLPAQPA